MVFSSELLDAGTLPATGRSMGCPEPHQDGPVRRCKRRDQDVLAGGDVDDGDVGEVVAAGRRGCGRGRWRRFGCGRGRRWRWRWRWRRRFGGRWWRWRWWRWRFGGRWWRFGGRWWRFGGRWRRFGGRWRRFGGRWWRWRWWRFGGRWWRFVGCRGWWRWGRLGAAVRRRVRTGLRCRCGGRGGHRRWFSGLRRRRRCVLRRCGSLRRWWRWGRLGAAVRRRLGTGLRRRCGGGSRGGGLCVSALGAPAGGRDQRGDAQHGDAQQQDGGNCASPVVAVVLWFADGHNSPSPSRNRAGGGVTVSTVAGCRIRVRRRCPARPPRRSRRSCLRRTHRRP